MLFTLLVGRNISSSAGDTATTQREKHMTNEQQIETMLHSIESALIVKMAEAAGCQPFQMKSMISRCEELKQYFYQMRSQIIHEMAEAA